jgi:hypothetical protein
MKTKRWMLLVIGVVFFLLGCATMSGQWREAERLGTVEAYESFLKEYPSGQYSLQVRSRLAVLYEEKEWSRVKQQNTIAAYEDFLARYSKGRQTESAKERLKDLYNIKAAEIDKIQEKTAAELPNDTISRLVMAGANCIGDNANWVDISQGRKVYDILKRTQGPLVVGSLRRVVITTINRNKVLFLAVKLGINGTEEPLNQLLLEYGDKQMAEDYLNSGSSKLHDGGAEWAKKRGYRIRTGSGSHRTRWGSF